MSDPFAGRVALVTGGASGIGRALGQALVRRGARVVLADLDGEAAEAAAASMNAATGGRGSAAGAGLDVRDADRFAALAGEVAGAHGRIDLFFNNAGVFLVGETHEHTLADWERVLSVNLDGVIHGIAAVYPLMVEQGSGHVVNTASGAGLIPVPGSTAYATSKHAVVGLSRALRIEGADLGVRVSALCPGYVDTPIYDRMTVLHEDRLTVSRRDLPARTLGLVPGTPWSAARTAAAALRGVERDRAVILATPDARLLVAAYRLSPWLCERTAGFSVRRLRELIGSAPANR